MQQTRLIKRARISAPLGLHLSTISSAAARRKGPGATAAEQRSSGATANVLERENHFSAVGTLPPSLRSPREAAAAETAAQQLRMRPKKREKKWRT